MILNPENLEELQIKIQVLVQKTLKIHKYDEIMTLFRIKVNINSSYDISARLAFLYIFMKGKW